jgi:GNAT superfamily N-acetyltransferase
MLPLEKLAHVSIQPAELSIRGQRYRLRLLNKFDGPALESFLRGLSRATTLRWGAHHPDLLSAADACAAIGTDGTIRVVAEALRERGDELAAYAVLHTVFPDYERARYAKYGIELDANCLRLAPAVADGYQGKGVGSALLRWIVQLADQLGVSKLVLWAGVHFDNHAGLALYLKTGFQHAGVFYWEKPELSPDTPMKIHDMMLEVAKVMRQGRTGE